MVRKPISDPLVYGPPQKVTRRGPADALVIEELIASGAARRVVYAYSMTAHHCQSSSATCAGDRALWDAGLREFEAIEWEASRRPRQ